MDKFRCWTLHLLHFIEPMQELKSFELNFTGPPLLDMYINTPPFPHYWNRLYRFHIKH